MRKKYCVSCNVEINPYNTLGYCKWCQEILGDDLMETDEEEDDDVE